MAEANVVVKSMAQVEAQIPPRDDLIAGPHGVIHTDLVRVRTNDTSGDSLNGITIKRGTLLFKSAVTWTVDSETHTDDCFMVPTSNDVVSGKLFAILADDVTIKSTEFMDAPAYFEGDFHADCVILPEGVDITVARFVLNGSKIFLRERHSGSLKREGD